MSSMVVPAEVAALCPADSGVFRQIHPIKPFPDLGESSLGLTPSGRAYLTYLLGKASANITLDGRGGDAEALSIAEQRVEQLLATAAGASATSEGSYLDLQAGLGRGRSPGRISAEDLRRALRILGPVWPFVRRNA